MLRAPQPFTCKSSSSLEREFFFALEIFTSFLSQYSLVSLTNRFHVAVRLFSNTSQMTSKCGKNKKVAHEAQPSVSLMFLPHFDVLCDLLLNRRTATWNLFVLYNKELKYTEKKPFYFNRVKSSQVLLSRFQQRNVFFFSSSCLS